MPNMRAVQVTRPGGPLELVERPVPEPGPGAVRVKVQACGICHSGWLTKEATCRASSTCGCPGTKSSA